MSSNWNEIIAHLPGAHLLQTYEWGQVKTQNGWQPQYLVWLHKSNGSQIHLQQFRDPRDGKLNFESNKVVAAAQLLVRSVGSHLQLSIAYCPKGPLLNWSDELLRRHVLADLKSTARVEGAFLLKIDPDLQIGRGEPGSQEEITNPVGESVLHELVNSGWRFSSEQIQFRNTVVLDLNPSSDTLLAGFKQKTRYNIRLAERRGVTVRHGGKADIARLYEMYAETAVRDHFTIRDLTYYQKAWGDFIDAPKDIPVLEQMGNKPKPSAEVLIAEFEENPIAALIAYRFAGHAWFMFGMSRSAHREKMPNYLLQWEAIMHLKAIGCTTYDLWGAPDDFSKNDPLWGVYRFKAGFRGDVVRHMGAYDFPLKQLPYQLYSGIMPKILSVMRSRGNQNTRRTLE